MAKKQLLFKRNLKVNNTMGVRKNRKYICIQDCGRSTTPGSRRGDVAEFIRGEIYPCEEDDFLTNEFGEKRRVSERALKLFFKQYRKPKEIVAEGLFPNDEMTMWAFTSNMEDLIKQLLKDPRKAKASSFLERHGIDTPKAIELLVKKNDPNNPESAILIRKERIEDGGIDENGNRLQDKFHIKYSLPRKDYDKKMRKLYINLFENYRCDNPMLNEDGEAMGSTSCESSGQFVQPLFGKPITRKIYHHEPKKKRKIKITEEQLNAIKEATTTFGMTPQGNAMGDMTPPGCFNDKETNDHKNMIKKSSEEYEWNINEEGIHIKEKNKGKFTATKKRTGKSTEELTHSKNPLTKKRAVFAQNARRWSKKN